MVVKTDDLYIGKIVIIVKTKRFVYWENNSSFYASACALGNVEYNIPNRSRSEVFHILDSIHQIRHVTKMHQCNGFAFLLNSLFCFRLTLRC
jgi:hypothetical protein